MNTIASHPFKTNSAIYIHSFEPIWIDYGVFQRLPNPGEDIYCDNLNFRFGLGYNLTRWLSKLEVPALFSLHFSEEIFRNLAIQQAYQDGLEKYIIHSDQCFPASLAVSAPLKSGEQKLILVNPPRQVDATTFCSSVPDDSWLVLVDWKPDNGLEQVFETCRDKNVHVCLGLPWHEEVPVDRVDLELLLKKQSPVEMVFTYSPAYLPMSLLAVYDEAIQAVRDSIPVMILAHRDNAMVLHTEKEWQAEPKTGLNQHDQLSCLLTAFLKARSGGLSIEESLTYTQFR